MVILKLCDNIIDYTFIGPDPFDSQQFYNVALDAANKGNYDSALANFRAAVRHNNKSPLYWNDLGMFYNL